MERSSERKTHRFIEKRSIALHALVREKLILNPALVGKIKEHTRRLSSDHPSSAYYFDRWLEILEGDLEVLLNRLIEDSEEMCTLRQSSPFAGIIEPRERWRVYETFRT